MRLRPRTVLALIGLLVWVWATQASAGSRGILGQPAPALWAESWLNSRHTASELDLSQYRGKVVYVLFFQSWCPGCHSHGFPSLKAVRKHYAGRDEIVFLAVQTVFEGFHTNGIEACAETAARFDLDDIVFGHDPGPDGRRSENMRRYRSGGTPWTVVIDPDGIVRFNNFRLKPAQGVRLIDRLLAQPR